MAKRFLPVSDEEAGGVRKIRDVVTYQKAVLHNRCKIGYPIETASSQVATKSPPPSVQGNGVQDNDSFHQPVIPPSLVWRFIGWLGGLSLMLDKAREMILKKNPNSLCHRMTACVDPGRARSDERLHAMETAQELLLVIPEWQDLHGCRFFPRFAIRSGFN